MQIHSASFHWRHSKLLPMGILSGGCSTYSVGLHEHFLVRLLELTFFSLQTTLKYSLTVLFYCAHVKMFHYFEFCRKRAVNTLASVLQSPVAHIRLLTRLVICCLLPVLEDSDMTLLRMTDEESLLILMYIKDNMELPGGLDLAKFLMATSILYGDVCPQNASGPLAMTLAETLVQHIYNLHDNCILESALCLLWTLCHTPCIVQRLSQIDYLVPELKTMEQTRCSAVSFLAKAVLWKLGCGNYEGTISLDFIPNLLYHGIKQVIYLCIMIVSFHIASKSSVLL